jgi:hypothetical protein
VRVEREEGERDAHLRRGRSEGVLVLAGSWLLGRRWGSDPGYRTLCFVRGVMARGELRGRGEGCGKELVVGRSLADEAKSLVFLRRGHRQPPLSLACPQDARSVMSGRPGFLPPPGAASAYNPNLAFRPPPLYNTQPAGSSTPRTYLPPPSLNPSAVRAGPTPQQIQAYQFQLQAQQHAQNAIANNAYQSPSNATRASKKDKDKGPGPFSTSRKSLFCYEYALAGTSRKVRRTTRSYRLLVTPFVSCLLPVTSSPPSEEHDVRLWRRPRSSGRLCSRYGGSLWPLCY